ncbi:hypothetical protein CANARDRAFT_5999 [[Candida] arabinofermentans NRRL YB-2248]|uniref:Uncharacterized protein n=1 Tax=[Candida] arabinofermentans NRRL YB-2248 TaxID=983967 RepID=A0A1E4T6S9_9ASCO|nr:hypothetical protein CANARDRAFT_5999 [[Candida] arabinofermentans NRRL YB-2248]
MPSSLSEISEGNTSSYNKKSTHPRRKYQTPTVQVEDRSSMLIDRWSSSNLVLNQNAQFSSLKDDKYHVIMHDKLVFKGFSLIDAIIRLVSVKFPNLKLDVALLTRKWEDEFLKVEIQDRKPTELLAKLKLRELIRNVFHSRVMLRKEYQKSFNTFINSKNLESELSALLQSGLYSNVSASSFIESLKSSGIAGEVSIAKDQQLSLLNFVNYNRLTSDTIGKEIGVLDYKFIFGNKSNDYINMEQLGNLLKKSKSSNFMLVTNEERTSFEYFRMLRLLGQVANSRDSSPWLQKLSNKKGCVVYIKNKDDSLGGDRMAKHSSNLKYFVISDFQYLSNVVSLIRASSVSSSS